MLFRDREKIMLMSIRNTVKTEKTTRCHKKEVAHPAESEVARILVRFVRPQTNVGFQQ